VKLQSHYASILNVYDGGHRLQFSGPAEWIQRLIETGTIPKPIENANPPGLTFEFDGKTMRYFYPDAPHPLAGWIVWKHPEGQWVTLRKATDDDIARINAAVSKAHHEEP
jgi:hypothetical protein